MRIISIVPRLPPTIDGVGDYALNLASQLRKDFVMETHFVVGDSTWTGATNIKGFPISKVTASSASNLLSLLSLDISTVLLHYVGYGYAKRGCPFWLVEALERWKSSITNARLVTMFHEVYASGPIWTSAFWLSKLQRNLAARLVQLSDRVFTSKELYAKIISQLSHGKHTQIPVLPVFSNIGEPSQVPPLLERARQLVVFGGRSNRLRVYQNSWSELNRVCGQLGIEKILDIGTPTGLTLSSVNSIPIVELGQQPASEVSRLLGNSLAGLFNYPTDFLAKSTIFAAYCAHGLLPVSAQDNNCLIADGIEAQKHYCILDLQSLSFNLLEMQAIADRAYTWYQAHSLPVQAKIYAKHLVNHE